MANELTLPAAFNNPNALAALDPNWNVSGQSEFSGGIRRGYAVVSLRGKVWRITHQGVERVVTRQDGSGDPASTLSAIIIRGGSELAKVYYAGGYVDGSSEAPDCFSNDGIRPDRSIQAPQCASCMTCPQNVWGSKITEQGKQTKACADSKRLAILPLPQDGIVGDDALNAMDNEMFGGPMLLRVPAASLVDLAQFDSQMRSAGYPIYAVGVALSFDVEAPFPKLIYKAVRPLTEEEFAVALEHRDSDQAFEIVGLPRGGAAALPAPEPVAPVTPQAPVAVAAPQPVQQAAPVVAQPIQQPVPQAAPVAAQPVAQPVAQPAPAPAPRRPRRGPAPQPAQQGAPVAQPVQAAPVAAQPVAQPVQAAPVAAQPVAQPTAVNAGNIDDVLASLGLPS